MVYLTKGDVFLGGTQIAKDGNIVKDVPPRFEENEQGSCVIVGLMESDTNKPIGTADVFGDWQADKYFKKVLELLSPNRPINLPNFKKMICEAYKDGFDICDYCNLDCSHCQDCVVDEWKNNEN